LQATCIAPDAAVPARPSGSSDRRRPGDGERERRSICRLQCDALRSLHAIVAPGRPRRPDASSTAAGALSAGRAERRDDDAAWTRRRAAHIVHAWCAARRRGRWLPCPSARPSAPAPRRPWGWFLPHRRRVASAPARLPACPPGRRPTPSTAAPSSPCAQHHRRRARTLWLPASGPPAPPRCPPACDGGCIAPPGHCRGCPPGRRPSAPALPTAHVEPAPEPALHITLVCVVEFLFLTHPRPQWSRPAPSALQQHANRSAVQRAGPWLPLGSSAGRLAVWSSKLRRQN
jgi:hypothetical protein